MRETSAPANPCYELDHRTPNGVQIIKENLRIGEQMDFLVGTTGARRPDDAAVVEVTGSGSTFNPSSPRALFPTCVTWFENQATARRYAPSLLHLLPS